MSFSFALSCAPSRGLRALHGATVGLAAAGFALAAWLAPQPWGIALAAAAVPACWLAWRHGARGLSWGRLAVDESGQARWQQAGAVPTRDPRPVRIERWCATEQLIWVRFCEAGRRRHRDVLFARAGCDAGQWRGLRSWLAWLGRGSA